MTYRLFIFTAVVVALILAAAKKTVFGDDLSVYYQAQRNSAMDLVAQCSASNVDLQKRVAELEKQLKEK